MRWMYAPTDERAAEAPTSRALGRSRRVRLTHVDGAALGSWPLGGVVRSAGQAFRVTRHEGVPPIPGQLDWTFDVWGVQVR